MLPKVLLARPEHISAAEVFQGEHIATLTDAEECASRAGRHDTQSRAQRGLCASLPDTANCPRCNSRGCFLT